jgi:hypothetical protein
MLNEYLRAFVIGSSFPVFVPFFYSVSRFEKEKFNFNYEAYTFLAPPSLGFMNVISLFLANQLNINKKLRFLLTSLIAPTLVLCSVIFFNIYNYTFEDWVSHIVQLYLLYFIVVNVVIYNLDKYV